MDINICDFNVLIVLHQVDGGSNLLQLSSILTEVGKNITLVNHKAEISFTLFGSHLLGFRLWLHEEILRNLRCTVDIRNRCIVLFYQVAASAEIFFHREFELLHPFLIRNRLGEVNLLTGLVLAGKNLCLRILLAVGKSAVSYSLVSTLDDDRVESDSISSFHYRCENYLLL